jgi:hypothetical protein
MRFEVLAVLLASACVRYDSTPLELHSVAMSRPIPGLPTTGTTGTPLHVCDLEEIALDVSGSGFAPDVRDAMADQPELSYPAVELAGPATIAGVVDRQSTGTQILVSFPRTAPDGGPWPYGLYSVRVIDFDNRRVELPDAVSLSIGPPVSSVAPTSTCYQRSTTVSIRGGPFTGPVRVATYFGSTYVGGTDVDAQLVASDEIDATVPPQWDTRPYDLWVFDGDSCPTSVHMTQVFCP